MNPFLIFGVLAMAYAAVVMRHEGRARALAIVGLTWLLLGLLLDVMPYLSTGGG
jgi:hypothetical protein